MAGCRPWQGDPSPTKGPLTNANPKKSIYLIGHYFFDDKDSRAAVDLLFYLRPTNLGTYDLTLI